MAFVNILRPAWPFMSGAPARAHGSGAGGFTRLAPGPAAAAGPGAAFAEPLLAGPALVPELHLQLSHGSEALALADALTATELAAGWGARRVVLHDPGLRHGGLRLLLQHARQRGLATELRFAGDWPLPLGALDTLRLAEQVAVEPMPLLPPPGAAPGRSATDAPLFCTLDRLDRAGLAFHLRLPVVRENLESLDALVARARGCGTGSITLLSRAAGLGTPLDDAEKALLSVSTQLLHARHGTRMSVRGDLLPLHTVLARPAFLFAHAAGQLASASPMQQLGRLALAADGTLLPLHPAFDRRWSLGEVRELHRRGGAAAWADWSRRGYAALRELGRGLFADLAIDAPMVVDPLDALMTTAALPNRELAPGSA